MMWKSKLFWICVILFVLPLLIEEVARRRCWKYSRIGGVQVIAGPEEMWVFLQIDHKVTWSCVICENPHRKIGHSQQLLVITENGVVEKNTISLERGVSLSWNFSTVFESEGRVYFYDDFTTSRDSVFEWTGQEFERLPSDEAAAVLSTIRRDEHGRLDWEWYFRKSDWKQLLAQDYMLGSESFEWNGRKYTIEVQSDEDASESRVVLHGSGEGDAWSEEIARISKSESISRSEMESLMEEWWRKTQSRN